MKREDIIKSNVGGKYHAPTCLVCNQVYKHYKFVNGRMIKFICKCNINLLEEEANRIIQKQKIREESSTYMGVKIIEFKG